MNNKKFDVLVVGELNVDLILNGIDSFPEMGKEKLADDMTLTLGSSSAIFASNISALGARVAFLGKIGDDSFGDLVEKSLKSKGVETRYIVRDGSVSTGATIVMNYGEDRAMVTHMGAMKALTIDDISDEALGSARHLHFSSYYLQPGIRRDVAGLFSEAKKRGMTTSFDMQWDPEEKWDLDYRSILRHVDVFLPNEEEITRLTGTRTVPEALDRTADISNIVAVKMGAKGSVVRGSGKVSTRESYLNTEVVDAIGAGDSFNAGFIFKFIGGASVDECQEFGNLMGAVNTTAAGGTTAFTNYEAVMKTASEKFGYTNR